MGQESNRMKYIEGIRGLCCIYVSLFHFGLAFLPFGFIGWGSGILPEEEYATYFNFFPYSIFINSHFVLFFMSIIGFTIAYHYFQTNDIKFLQRQAKKRYLRIMPTVAVCTFIGYFIYYFSLNYNIILADYLGFSWIAEVSRGEHSFFGALTSGLLGVLLENDGRYCSVLWCFYILFLGSYLVYGFLALMGQSERRWIAYCALTIALWWTGNTNFVPFVAGMSAADILLHCEKIKKIKSYMSWVFIILGLVIATIPEVILPKPFDSSIVMAIGTFLLLLGTSSNDSIKRFLSSKPLMYAAKYGYASVLVHFHILITVVCWFYYTTDTLFHNQLLSLVGSFILYTVAIIIASIAFYNYIELPFAKLANRKLPWNKI